MYFSTIELIEIKELLQTLLKFSDNNSQIELHLDLLERIEKEIEHREYLTNSRSNN